MRQEWACTARWRPALAGAASAILIVFPLVPSSPATAGPSFRSATEISQPADASPIPDAGLNAVACPAAGACASGGTYRDSAGHLMALASSQARGRWQRATALALPPGAVANPYAEVNGLACVSAGTCVAVGDYQHDQAGDTQAFMAVQTHGKWARAFVPTAPADAAAVPQATLGAVACLPTGFCEAIGSYQDAAGRSQAMALARPPGGRWGAATEITAPAGSATDPSAFATGISCTSAGNCVAVGNYDVPGTGIQAMGIAEIKGRWHRAARITPPANARPGFYATIRSVSCPSHGHCLGVGSYYVTATRFSAMSVTESGGHFAAATQITALPADARAAADSYLSGISCPTAAACVAVGGYASTSDHNVAMYLIRVASHWLAVTLPQPPNAETGRSQFSSLHSVSCSGAGHCAAAGYYNGPSGSNRPESAWMG